MVQVNFLTSHPDGSETRVAPDEIESVEESTDTQLSTAEVDEEGTVPAATVFGLDEPLLDENEDDIRVRDDEFARTVLREVFEFYHSTDVEYAESPDPSFIAERYFDFSFRDDQEIEEWMWTNKPDAIVAVVQDERARERRYRVLEPQLSESEEFIREDLIAVLRNNLLYREPPTDGNRRGRFRAEAEEVIQANATDISNGTLHKLMYYLIRDFVDYGRVDPIMRDPAIEDISCDGSAVPVFVYHRDHRDLQTNVTYEAGRLNSFVSRLAQRAHKQLTVSDPLVDASLPDGSRIQLTLGGDISTRGSNFTIRKFADVPITPVDLVDWNTFSAEQMAYFWLVIENNKSLIFAGGTGSGKTTSMNAVSFFIPPNSKVVSIEDTREVDLPHQNWVQTVSRLGTSAGRGEVSMYRLLQSALRQRPEYIIVGEIRTQERVALTFFQAMSTGHTAYTTVHADSVEAVIGRLQNPPLNVPVQLLSDLDVICIQRQAYLGKQRVRRNISVAEVTGNTADEITTEMVFERNAETDEFDRLGNSDVLAEIAHDRGWGDAALQRELDLRRDILEYLIANDIRSYEAVASAIHHFSRDREWLLEAMEDGSLTEAVLVDEDEVHLDTLRDVADLQEAIDR